MDFGEVFKDEPGKSVERNGEDNRGEVPCDEDDDLDCVDGDKDDEGGEHDPIHCDGWGMLVDFERVIVAWFLILGLVSCGFYLRSVGIDVDGGCDEEELNSVTIRVFVL